jgi:hypothetical protein
MPFDMLGPIGSIKSGQSTLEYGNVGVSNCVYLCLQGDEDVVPCLIYTPDELDCLLAMVDLACNEQERIEKGSVLRLGVMPPKPMTLRVALIHPHNGPPQLLLRVYQGQWKCDVMAAPKDVAMLLRQGKVEGPAPLSGPLRRVDDSNWEIDGKRLLLLEGLSPGAGAYGQYVHPQEVEEGTQLKVWLYQREGKEFVAAFRVHSAVVASDPSEGERADDLLFRGETYLARRAYQQLSGISKCPRKWLARATLGTLVAMVLEGDDQTGHQVWLGRSQEKWQQVGLQALESGALSERDNLVFQQVAAYYHSMNPDSAQASKAVQRIMEDVYRRSRSQEKAFRRTVLSNWYLFLREVYEAPPPEQALGAWSECLRDFGGEVKPKALWFPTPSEWPPVESSTPVGLPMPQLPSLADNPVLVKFLRGVAVFCGVLFFLYLAAPTFSCNGDSGVRIAGPGRVTMSGLGVDRNRDQFLADGWSPSPRMPANLRKGNLFATFDKEGELIELWGAELMLDGKVVARSGQSRSEVFGILGEPNKTLGRKQIYYYIFDDGGQRKALRVDASMGTEEVGLSLMPADDSFEEVDEIDMIKRLSR